MVRSCSGCVDGMSPQVWQHVYRGRGNSNSVRVGGENSAAALKSFYSYQKGVVSFLCRIGLIRNDGELAQPDFRMRGTRCACL